MCYVFSSTSGPYLEHLKHFSKDRNHRNPGPKQIKIRFAKFIAKHCEVPIDKTNVVSVADLRIGRQPAEKKQRP